MTSKMMDRKDMCGLGVVIEELPHTQGYDLHMDNDVPGQVTTVDFDFGGSDNLALADTEASEIEIKGSLLATVTAPAGAKALKLSLRQIDPKKNIELRLQTTPSEEIVPITLECNVILKAKSLAGLKGYDLRFTNPTDEDITLEFNFAQSENLAIRGRGNTKVEDTIAIVAVPPHAEDVDFVTLETIDPAKQIAMEYSLASYPTKDADPPATRDALKCGAYLTLQPMPKAAGYEFSFDNPTDKAHKLSFDFTKSINLRLDGAASCVRFEGNIAHVDLAVGQDKFLAFSLHSVDKTKGVAMSYVLHSEAGDPSLAPVPAAAAAE